MSLSSSARIWEEQSTTHSSSALFLFVCLFAFFLSFFLFFFFSSEDQLARTSYTLYVRFSPQWLSELRRLWPNVSGYVPKLSARRVAQSAHSDFVGSRLHACLGVTCSLGFELATFRRSSQQAIPAFRCKGDARRGDDVFILLQPV